jgi:parallel beta-helix repeat protein
MNRKSFFVLLAVACSVILIILLIKYYPQHTGVIRVPQQYPTIQKAINAAKPGDTISVASGTYMERIFINKTLTLAGDNRNNTIIDADHDTGPVVFINASNVNITGFTIRNSHPESYGIYIQNSLNSSISGNIITANNRGIFITYCINVMVTNNTVTNDRSIGLYIGDSTNITLKNNKLTGNRYNLGVEGRSLSQFTHNIDVSNTVNGKPIYYFINQSNKIVPADAGYVGAINCVNITVKNMILSNNRQGILFAYTKNSIIRNVTAANNTEGILLSNSYNNIIVNDTIAYNRYFGIALSFYSSNNTVSNNLIIKNTSTIFNETTDGIKLENHATANTIVGNNVSDNINGIRAILSSDNNEIYHNNFINNTLREYSQLSTNDWDDGYPSGGNYWSDYVERYPDAVQIDDSGIWNTPYVIDEDNQDNYPLMNPFMFP